MIETVRLLVIAPHKIHSTQKLDSKRHTAQSFLALFVTSNRYNQPVLLLEST